MSIALVQNWVEPILGSRFIAQAQKPQLERELRNKLQEVLHYTEQIFIAESDNKTLAAGLLDLPVSDLTIVMKAIRRFYDRPNSPELADVLGKKLSEDFPSLSINEIRTAVVKFISILRIEISNVDSEIRDKLSTHAQLELAMRFNLMEIPSKEEKASYQGQLPPLPDFRTFVGRARDLAELKSRIGLSRENGEKRFTIMRGWPGVGKTTLSTVLAHQIDVKQEYCDGIFWTSLGDNANIAATLNSWGQAVGINDLIAISASIEDAVARLRTSFSKKKALLIVDDVYDLEDGKPFRDIGGINCATLFTTRFPKVAVNLAENPEQDIYVLSQLSNEHALELLGILVPEAVKQYPNEALQLVSDLEGLPLAIQVAGRMLQAEKTNAANIPFLLNELRESTRIIEQQSPANRIGLADETNLTIEALLRKSTDRLSQTNREHFAFLGYLAPKPATFTIGAMQALWNIKKANEALPIIRDLVDRGLLEYDHQNERYQMHALLVKLAQYLLGDT